VTTAQRWREAEDVAVGPAGRAVGAEEHQFCLAHLIRDAQYAIDHGDTIFGPDFKALLKDACAVDRRRPDLADATIATHRRRLDIHRVSQLAALGTGRLACEQPLQLPIYCSDKLFVFMMRRDAEPTNNESERAMLNRRNRPQQRPERSLPIRDALALAAAQRSQLDRLYQRVIKELDSLIRAVDLKVRLSA